jgi:hypothetical protein
MKLNIIKERWKPGDEFSFWPLGDVHLGSANCDKKLLTSIAEQIQEDPLARWGGMGEWSGLDAEAVG